jgi:DHA1 family bicyclomycin/chloramphenicol resistance-like MFS transporter
LSKLILRIGAGFRSASLGALLMVLIAERGKFFQPQNLPVQM